MLKILESYESVQATYEAFPGVQSGTLKIQPLSISSIHTPSETAKLDYFQSDNDLGWAASLNNLNEYIQISSPVPYTFNKIITRGRDSRNEFISSYYLSYSLDNINWVNYNNQEILRGNTDSQNIIENLLSPFLARSLRLYPVTRVGWVATKIEAYISKSTYKGTLISGSLIKAVTGGFNIEWSGRWAALHDLNIYLNSYSPVGALGLCPYTNEGYEWVMVNAGRLVYWNTIQIQGRGDYNGWTTSIKISYTVNGLDWILYNNGVSLNTNYDRYTIVNIDLAPFIALSIKIYTITVYNSNCLRLEVVCSEI